MKNSLSTHDSDLSTAVKDADSSAYSACWCSAFVLQKSEASSGVLGNARSQKLTVSRVGVVSNRITLAVATVNAAH